MTHDSTFVDVKPIGANESLRTQAIQSNYVAVESSQDAIK